MSYSPSTNFFRINNNGVNESITLTPINGSSTLGTASNKWSQIFIDTLTLTTFTGTSASFTGEIDVYNVMISDTLQVGTTGDHGNISLVGEMDTIDLNVSGTTVNASNLTVVDGATDILTFNAGDVDIQNYNITINSDIILNRYTEETFGDRSFEYLICQNLAVNKYLNITGGFNDSKNKLTVTSNDPDVNLVTAVFLGNANNYYTATFEGKISAEGVDITSDRNLKENIVNFDNSLKILMDLELCSYNMKTDESKWNLGLIAQDVETVLQQHGISDINNLVTKGETYGLNQLAITLLAVGACQDLKRQVDEAKIKTQELLARMKKLESR